MFIRLCHMFVCFYGCENDKFKIKTCDLFLYSLVRYCHFGVSPGNYSDSDSQHIVTGYTLEPTSRGGYFREFHRTTIKSKNKELIYTTLLL